MESDIDSLLGGSLDFVYCCSCCNSLEFGREIKCPFKLKNKSVKNSKIMKNYNTITIQLQYDYNTITIQLQSDYNTITI